MANIINKPEIIKNIPLKLTKQGLFRRIGFKNRSRVPAVEIMAEFDYAMNIVKSKDLIKGQAVVSAQKIAVMSDKKIIFTNGISIPGEKIHKLMQHARFIALAICTIGKKLETMTREFIKNGNPLAGMMLDSIGSAAVDCLVEETAHHISSIAEKMNMTSSSPVSPGMPGLPLKAQNILFDLLPAEAINVKLTPSGIMLPFKSSSMIMGLGKNMPTWTQREVCRDCHLFPHCRYKTY